MVPAGIEVIYLKYLHFDVAERNSVFIYRQKQGPTSYLS